LAQYVMFVDESGDHNLQNIDDNFPLFCLCGCVFEKEYYSATARPLIDNLKIRFWNSTDVILLSRDIRRQQGAFYFLKERHKREEFYEALNELMRRLDFSIIAIAILKREHLAQYGDRARHPYHLSLEFMMERFGLTMRRSGGSNEGHVIAESRGRVEDKLLKEEFFRLKTEGSDYQGFEEITTLWTEKKRKNIVGLQIADLAAYPIARKILDPTGAQLSFDVLRAKICHKPGEPNCILGYGIKIFPQATFDHYLHLDGEL
jgi:hypothetical protein